jgi:hypothetical protein
MIQLHALELTRFGHHTPLTPVHPYKLSWYTCDVPCTAGSMIELMKFDMVGTTCWLVVGSGSISTCVGSPCKVVICAELH